MITPYLHFQGNCRAAMTAYQDILGGELQMMSYSQMPEAPPQMADSALVMHSALMSPHGDINASDFPPGAEGTPQAAVSIALQTDGVDEAKRIYDALAEDGVAIQPFGPAFFTPGFGMCSDRFGTQWIVMAAPQDG